MNIPPSTSHLTHSDHLATKHSGVVELALLTRSGLVESRHLGRAVVVEPSGSIAAGYGGIDDLIYPRSTLKPLQAAAMLAADAPIAGVQIGLATASHVGQADQLEVVRSILSDGQLHETDLQCPPSWPGDIDARVVWSGEGGEPSRLCMNCSGKHATMLRTCQAQGWPLESYLELDHPLQRHIRDVIESATGTTVSHSGVDGCGAPLHALPLTALARGIQWAVMSAPSNNDVYRASAARVVEAVRRDPWTVHGHGQTNTVVLERLGTFAKGGAEGVMVMVAPTGHAVALKILDGSERAATAVALELLVAHSALDQQKVSEIRAITDPPVMGGSEPVGELQVSVT